MDLTLYNILLCGIPLILIFGGVGVFLIVFSLRTQKKADSGQSWPGTTGTILRTEVRQSQGIADEHGVSQTVYYPAVEFEYQVGEQTFKGDKIAFGDRPTYKSQSEAASLLSIYRVSNQVRVYYNPANPSGAILERKPPSGRLGLTVGIVMLVLIVCTICPVLFSFLGSFLAAR
jgi:hypothetical protein